MLPPTIDHGCASGLDGTREQQHGRRAHRRDQPRAGMRSDRDEPDHAGDEDADQRAEARPESFGHVDRRTRRYPATQPPGVRDDHRGYSRATGRRRSRRGPASGAFAASHRLRVQLAADQHAPDLARAGADLVELGVAPQAPDRVLVGVADAAERPGSPRRPSRSPSRPSRGSRRPRPCAACAHGRRDRRPGRPRRRRRATPATSCTCRRACPASAGTRRSLWPNCLRSWTKGSTTSMHAAMMPSGPPESTARS